MVWNVFFLFFSYYFYFVLVIRITGLEYFLASTSPLLLFRYSFTFSLYFSLLFPLPVIIIVIFFNLFLVFCRAMAEEENKMIEYCKAHNIHHLLELLATRLLVERPENPFQFLRDLLSSVEESESKKQSYDPTEIQFSSSMSTEKGTSSREEVLQSQDLSDDKSKKSVRGEVAVSKKLIVAVLGLENAGKTTLISALGGDIVTQTTPTVGFAPVHFYTEEEDICLFDLGGASNFREVWVHYYADCHGLVYVVDSAADEGTIAESLRVLKEVLSHPYMQGKPTLIVANKKDLKGSRLEKVIPEGFLKGLPSGPPSFRIVATCSIVEDDQRDDGMDWLLGTIASQYETLATRVREDVAVEKEKKHKERQARLALILAEPS